jgi:hypothetical protein
MEAVHSPENILNIYQITWLPTPEDSTLMSPPWSPLEYATHILFQGLILCCQFQLLSAMEISRLFFGTVAKTEQSSSDPYICKWTILRITISKCKMDKVEETKFPNIKSKQLWWPLNHTP